MKSLLKVDFKEIQSIIYPGYFLREEEHWEELQMHTNETWELYLDGLKACEDYKRIEDKDIYEGIIFENDIPYAQFDIGGHIKYLEVTDAGPNQ